MATEEKMAEYRRDRRYAEARKNLLDIQAKANDVADDIEIEGFAHGVRAIGKRAKVFADSLRREDFEDGVEAPIDGPWRWADIIEEGEEGDDAS